MMMVMVMIEAGAFVAFASSQEAAVVEHVLGERIQRPEVAFAGIARFAWHFDETIVETEIVTDGVLPGGEFVLVVGESAAGVQERGLVFKHRLHLKFY